MTTNVLYFKQIGISMRYVLSCSLKTAMALTLDGRRPQRRWLDSVIMSYKERGIPRK